MIPCGVVLVKTQFTVKLVKTLSMQATVGIQFLEEMAAILSKSSMEVT